MINVLFFGPVADLAACRELQWPYQPGLTIKQLLENLTARFPQALELVCFIALDGEQVFDRDQILPDGCELALMSRFSGG